MEGKPPADFASLLYREASVRQAPPPPTPQEGWVTKSGTLFMGGSGVPKKFTELASSTGGAPRIGGGSSRAGSSRAAGGSLRLTLPVATPLPDGGGGGGGGGGAPASPARGGGAVGREASPPSSPSSGGDVAANNHHLQLLVALVGADEVMKLSLGCVVFAARAPASRASRPRQRPPPSLPLPPPPASPRSPAPPPR